MAIIKLFILGRIMAIDIALCQQALRKTLKDDYSLSTNLSLLTRDAWKGQKNQCLKEMGGIVAVEKYVNSLSQENIIYGEEDFSNLSGVFTEGLSQDANPGISLGSILGTNNNDTKNTQTSTGQQSDYGAAILGGAKTYLGYAGIILLSLIGTIFFYKLIRYLLVFFYDIFNAHRIVYLKVLLPRGDDKISREQGKDVAKDMKEKIGRMGQVYRNLHKIGDLNVYDIFMSKVFEKSKITFMLNYEEGLLSFIVGVYPEYKNIIEAAIGAQFADSSIEITTKPKFFQKKYSAITPLEPVKESIYPIRIFKQMEDDPLNNLIDSMAKIPSEDTFNIIMTIKPVGESFNKKARYIADGLYRKDKSITSKTPRWQYIIFPRKILQFIVSGPSQALLDATKRDPGQSDPMVRMVKAQEDALNVMAEEAGREAFLTGLMLVTSSDEQTRVKENINNMMGVFAIYKDEYNNELDNPEFSSDILGRFFKPLWVFSVNFLLPEFFFKPNYFTINSLTSIFHFPDGVFNRSPVIRWMDYKALAAPDNLPVMKDFSGYYITGVVAESFKKGVVSDIIKDMKHRAVGEKVEIKEQLTPVEKLSAEELNGAEIIEMNGKKFKRTEKEEKAHGFKIFKEGVLLGVNVFRNKFTPVYMKKKDRTRHHYIIGKSGGGKSVYIASLARQDIRNGDGICVIDPHGDLVDDILAYVPKERAKDVIYFDAGNEERPMGLNLYEIENYDQADRTVNDATEIFLKMFGGEVFGPRIQEYFKYGSLTLLSDFDDPPTLLDVPRLFTDETYREVKIKKVTNPVVRNFREKTYNAMGDREKQEIIPYFTSKFVSFNTNRLIRNIIGQTKSAFRFRPVMDEGKILLINLSKGKIGEINAQLLGMIIVSQVYNAAMSRANVPEDQRRDFYLYVDEFQNFVSGTFADILSEARKYHLALIMAHQYIAQLEPAKGLGGDGGGKGDVKSAVFGNVGTMQSFKVGAPDAEFLEKEYAPVLSAQDIVGISNYKVYIKLNINNSTSRVFSMDTIWTEDYKNPRIAGILKEYSAKKYGRERKFVDAEIQARLGLAGDENAVEETLAGTP